MQKFLGLLAIGASALFALPALAQTPEVTLTRLDGGSATIRGEDIDLTST